LLTFFLGGRIAKDEGIRSPMSAVEGLFKVTNINYEFEEGLII
jgi:hypothetical protein